MTFWYTGSAFTKSTAVCNIKQYNTNKVKAPGFKTLDLLQKMKIDLYSKYIITVLPANIYSNS